MKPVGHRAIYVEPRQGDIHDIVSRLRVAVGSPVVQAMAGTKDGTAPHRWAHPEGTGPDALEEQRLRLGYRVRMAVESLADTAAALSRHCRGGVRRIPNSITRLPSRSSRRCTPGKSSRLPRRSPHGRVTR